MSKTKEEILDEKGVRIFGNQQARIIEAMDTYSGQQLELFKEKMKKEIYEEMLVISNSPYLSYHKVKYIINTLKP